MNEHRHSLERSREIALSTIALHLVTTEVAKGYPPARVLNALRGNGTPKGSTRLIEVELMVGAFDTVLDSHDRVSLS